MHTRRYNILSCDGGPGPLTITRCLLAIEQKNPGFIQATDLFVGSSFGAFMAVYLALHMKQVDDGEWTGVELLQNCETFIAESIRHFLPEDVIEAWVQFLLGEGPLSDAKRLDAYMRREDNYGDAPLGALARRLVVHAGRMNAPWTPRVYDSAVTADKALPCADVALSSGAIPLYFPIRGVEVDGALSTNSPTMVGLVRAMTGGHASVPPVPQEAIRILALGSDSGSSKLANLLWPPGRVLPEMEVPAPGTAPAPPAPSPFQDIVRDMEALQAKALTAREVVRASFEEVKKRVEARGVTLGETARQIAEGACNQVEQGAAAALALIPRPDRTSTTLGWGWPPWLAVPTSPIFVIQVLLTGEALGVSQQASWLLGDRALRLAPTALVETNGMALLLALGLYDLANDAASLTAKLWAITEPPIVVDYLGFTPSFTDVAAWVTSNWLA